MYYLKSLQTETVIQDIAMNLQAHNYDNYDGANATFHGRLYRKKYVHNRVINVFSQLNTSTLNYNTR